MMAQNYPPLRLKKDLFFTYYNFKQKNTPPGKYMSFLSPPIQFFIFRQLCCISAFFFSSETLATLDLITRQATKLISINHTKLCVSFAKGFFHFNPRLSRQTMNSTTYLQVGRRTVAHSPSYRADKSFG